MADYDPLQSFTFKVDVNGLTGYFTSVDGLGSENEVTVGKFITPDGKEIQGKVPGRLTWGDVTFKRGISNDMGMWEWREKVVQGKMSEARTAVTITLLDRAYAPVITWNMQNAWPSKITAQSLSSESNDYAIEEMTVVHEGITREGVAGMPANRAP